MTSRRAAALVFFIVAFFGVHNAAAAAYPTIAFAETSLTVNESVGTVTLHLIRSGDLSLESKASIQLQHAGTTADGTDFSGAPTVVTFAPSEGAKDLPIAIVNDSVYEQTETLNPYIYSVYQAEIGSQSSVLITIDDDDPAAILGFAQSSFTAAEGAGTLTASVARSGVTNVTSTVTYTASALSGNTATATSDFTPTSGTLTFAPGETLKTFTVPILQDNVAEFTENFNLALTNVTNGAIVNGEVTASITDDDVPAQVAFSPASYSVDENGGPVTVTIVRSGNTTVATTVGYFLGGGTASTDDYLQISGNVTFAPGETQKSFSVSPFDDLIVEGNETFFAYLIGKDASQLSGPATITIVDNDGPTNLAFTGSAFQGDESEGQITVTVQRSGVTSGTTVATYATVNGSATAGSDYTATSGTLTFAPGETTKTFSIPLLNDSIAEPAENFTVTLSAPGAVVTRGTATVTITDDDVQSVFSLDASPSEVLEASGSIAVTFRRTGDVSGLGYVDYSMTNGTATSPSDYQAYSGTMIFNAGETVKTISIVIYNDTAVEPTETFTVQLSTPVAGTLGRSVHTISILDDDQPTLPPASYRFTPSYYDVSEGAGSVTVTVLREGNLSVPTSVNYSSTGGCCGNGAATPGADYLDVNGTLSFAAGETAKTISVPILQDNLIELSETFRVNLSLAGASATVSIRDDEQAPRLSVDNVVVDEGNAGARQVAVPLHLSAPAQYAFTLYYSTVNGSATAPGDYASQTGTVTFLAGETTKTLSLTINGDTADEGDEYFTIDFREYYYGVPGGSGMVTIRNDDASFSVGDVAVNEGDGGTAQATFTIRLSVPLSSPASLHYTTIAGTASYDSDFTAVSGTLTFAPGQTSKEVTVPIVGDRVAEPNETFFLRITDAIGAPISRSQGKATIVNDDEFYLEYDGLEYAGAGKHALALDLFVPTTESATPRPLVIWVHGDHWAGGSDGSRAASPAIREASRGYVVASIDYRSSDAAVFPAQIDDVKAAVRWLRANAVRYNIDPERVAVWGFGSGGHLAALLGTSGGVAALEDPSEGNPAFSSRVQLVVDWAGPTDLQQLQNDSLPCSTTNHDAAGSYASLLIGCALQRCPDRAAAASPVSYVTPDDPPFLLMHGSADCEIGPGQSESLSRVLRAAQVEVALHLYDDIGHNGPFWDSTEALTTVDAFLDSHFKARPRSRSVGH